MKMYRMVHLVTAEPMTFAEWVKERLCIPHPSDDKENGYCVTFHSGRRRWVKKHVFESDFEEVKERGDNA